MRSDVATLLSAGNPAVTGRARESAVSSRTVEGAQHQVTDDGRPLSLYANETPNIRNGILQPVGSGNGKRDAGGTFRLVSVEHWAMSGRRRLCDSTQMTSEATNLDSSNRVISPVRAEIMTRRSHI